MVDSGFSGRPAFAAGGQRFGGTLPRLLVAATGGSPYGFWGDYHPAHCVNIGGQLGSCMVDINDDRLDFQFFNADTNVLDHFTIIKDSPPRPRITAVGYAQNMISLTWNSTPGQRYEVYHQATLDAPPILVPSQSEPKGLALPGPGQ